MPELLRLDDVGRHYGTELSSLRRNCLARWERYCPPRDLSFDLLEIGAGSGASLRTWRAWFPKARLVGIDVRRIALDPEIEGCHIVHGAQTDPEVLRPLLQAYRFRMIVDDGSPYPEEKIQTFLTLFPWLAADSVYFCTGFDFSDTAPQASGPLPETEPGNDESLPRWFARLGATLAGIPAQTSSDTSLTIFGETVHHAREVAFLRGSVVIVR